MHKGVNVLICEYCGVQLSINDYFLTSKSNDGKVSSAVEKNVNIVCSVIRKLTTLTILTFRNFCRLYKSNDNDANDADGDAKSITGLMCDDRGLCWRCDVNIFHVSVTQFFHDANNAVNAVIALKAAKAVKAVNDADNEAPNDAPNDAGEVKVVIS